MELDAMAENYSFKEVWERIRSVTGWEKQQQLANFLGFKSSSISAPKKRDAFPIEWALKIAHEYQVSTDWILTGIDYGNAHATRASQDREENAPLKSMDERQANQQVNSLPQVRGHQVLREATTPEPEMFAYVPLVSVEMSAGHGTFVEREDVTGYYSFRKDWLARKTSGIKNVVLVTVRGSSMQPTLNDKDFVMVDTGITRIIDNLLYAIRLEDTVMVKRLQQRPENIIKVVSDNKAEYESYETSRENIHVIGQVVWSCRTYI